jgi:hypothetical protein
VFCVKKGGPAARRKEREGKERDEHDQNTLI